MWVDQEFLRNRCSSLQTRVNPCSRQCIAHAGTTVIQCAAGASHRLEPEWNFHETPEDFSRVLRSQGLQGWAGERGEVLDLVLYPRLGAFCNLCPMTSFENEWSCRGTPLPWLSACHIMPSRPTRASAMGLTALTKRTWWLAGWLAGVRTSDRAGGGIR